MPDDRFSGPVSGVDRLRDRPHQVEYFRAVEAARHGGHGERKGSAPRQAPRPRREAPGPHPSAPADEPRVVGTKLDVVA